MPTLRAVAIHMWQHISMYLRKAGTIILAVSVILWAATTWPKPAESKLAGLSPHDTHKLKLEYSAIGRLGRAIEPAIRPLGFDWKIGTALIGATAAKEVFVSQLAIVYAVGDDTSAPDTLREKLRSNYTGLQAFCVMLFCLIYAPCVATIAMTRQETNSWSLAGLQFFGLTAVAYLLTLVVYQVGSLVAG